MGCPDDNDLTKLLAGKLSSDRRREIEDHVDGCAGCQQLVSALARAESPEQRVTVTTRADTEPDSMESTLQEPRDPQSEGFDDCLTEEHVGRYQRGDLVGMGGIGRVLVAFDRHLRRQVAIKELIWDASEEMSLTTSATQKVPASRLPTELRLLSEARITGSLEHPGIVPVYELGKRANGTLYYTMKLVRGRTLANALRNQDLAGRLTLLPNFVDLCHAVGFAHGHGVIHRDLKPENVMLGEYGETIVLDWGLAKAKRQEEGHGGPFSDVMEQLAEADPAQTVEGTTLGTPAYMPPEQVRGELAKIDERSDVYALGVILYQILAGRPPHIGASSLEVMTKTIEEPVDPPSTHEQGAPPELAAIALRALNKDPAQRYPNAEALAEDVLAFQTGEIVRAHTYTPWSLVARWLRRNRGPLVAVCVALAVAGGAWWYRGRMDRRAREVAEQTRIGGVLREVDRTLALAREGTETDWLNIYTYNLIALKEPSVEQRLIKALDHPRAEVRRLAARSLGGMKSQRAVDALVRRLAPGVEPAPELVVEVINALGIIGDWRAEQAVAAARWRGGQWGFIWNSTELAYTMIPLPPLASMGPPTAEKWHERGRALFFKEQRVESLAAYTRALSLDPKYVRSYNNRAVVHKVLGNYRAALVDLDKSLELDPSAVLPRSNRAMVRRLVGDYEGARQDLEQVINRGDKIKFALIDRANLRSMMGDLEGAEADYQRLIAAEPDNPSNFYFQGVFWASHQRWTAALASFERALTLNPRFVDAFQLRAEVYQATDRQAEALVDLDRALTLAPSNGEARAARARLRVLLGQPEAAKRDLDASIQARPAEGPRWAARGVIYHAPAGRLDAALEDVRQGIRRAGRIERVQLLSCALALAERADRQSEQKELLAELRKEPEARYYEALVIRLLVGTLGARQREELTREAARLPERRCLYQLAAGIRAALDGDRTAALRAYRRSRQVAAPNDLACLTADTLAGKR